MMKSTDIKRNKKTSLPSTFIQLSPTPTPTPSPKQFNTFLKVKHLHKEQWTKSTWMCICLVMCMFLLQFTSITQYDYSRHVPVTLTPNPNPSGSIRTQSKFYQEKEEQQQHTNLNSMTSKTIQPLKWTCIWSPELNEQDDCNELLLKRLPPPNVPMNNSALQKQRWLFFGDSTMKHQLTLSNLNQLLVEEPLALTTNMTEGKNDDQCWSSLICEERHTDRCNHASVFQFDTIPDWKSPVYSPNFEGPAGHGVKEPYCSDCGGCDPHFLHCTLVPETDRSHIADLEFKTCWKKKLVYGGYMTIEFARDVELQSSMYRTTQENTAFYLREQFNTPELVRQWGKPICVIGTGFHDMILLLVTDDFNKDKFVDNVEWYLHIMKDVCSHIIWLTNTAPSRKNLQ